MAEIQLISFFQNHLDEESKKAVPCKIERNRKRFERLLSPIEDWIMALQSILVWENPVKSIVVLMVVNLGFWITDSTRVIAVLAWGTLLVYGLYIWKIQVWPTIRVPSSIKGEDDWTPVHARLMGVPELSKHLAEAFVMIRLYVKALKNLRKKRRAAFLVLAWVTCSILFVIGYSMSGYTTAWCFVMTLMLGPAASYHKILPKLYMRIEPYMMRLQYQLRPHVETSTHTKKTTEAGDSAETDSESEELPASDPAFNAALARTITDSEDEGQADLAEPLRADEDGASLFSTLTPDVSHMPDFERVCEESLTFLLDTDLMPSIDDIDHSRLLPPGPSHMIGHETDSDAESLPFDDEIQPAAGLPPHLAEPPSSISQQEEISAFNKITASLVQGLQSGLASRITSQLASAMANQLTSTTPQTTHTATDHDSDSEFEILSKEDLENELS